MSITGFRLKDNSVGHVDYNSLDNKPNLNGLDELRNSLSNRGIGYSDPSINLFNGNVQDNTSQEINPPVLVMEEGQVLRIYALCELGEVEENVEVISGESGPVFNLSITNDEATIQISFTYKIEENTNLIETNISSEGYIESLNLLLQIPEVVHKIDLKYENLPKPTQLDNGKVLEVVNGNYSLSSKQVFEVNFELLAEPTLTSNLSVDKSFADTMDAKESGKLVVFTFINKDRNGNVVDKMSTIAEMVRESSASSFYFVGYFPKYDGVNSKLTDVGAYIINFIGENTAIMGNQSFEVFSKDDIILSSD